MVDNDVPNAGQRRWLLNPSMNVTSFGDVGSVGMPVNAMYAINASNPYTTNRDGFVSWPPPGYVPAQLVSPWWSFSIGGADFYSTKVSVTSNTVPVPVA